jgi:hypothetical protein
VGVEAVADNGSGGLGRLDELETVALVLVEARRLGEPVQLVTRVHALESAELCANLKFEVGTAGAFLGPPAKANGRSALENSASGLLNAAGKAAR